MKAMLLIFSYLTLTLVVGGEVIMLQSVEDHFWRDYNGIVPVDALIVGYEAHEIDTFVGQFTVGGKPKWDTVPAAIKKHSKAAVSTYNGSVHVSTPQNSVKILCSTKSERYKWYSPLAQIPIGCRFVVAGRENSIPLYVGKAKGAQGDVILGKVFADSDSALVAPHNGVEESLKTYEVLTYCS